MKTIRLKTALPDEEVDALAGSYLGPSSYDLLIEEDAKVLKPDGSVLLIFRKGILPSKACHRAFPALRTAAHKSQNRGMAAGIIDSKKELEKLGPRFVKQGCVLADGVDETGKRYLPIKADGTVSNTSYAKPVESGIIGFFDRNARFPYCRLTAFNLEHPERFQAAMPFIRAVDRCFQENMPDRHQAQLEVVQRTSPDFVIHGTAFTTVTVNKNWRTACHQDAGDLKAGFGVMSALTAGKFKGCFLVFPKYRVAANMRTQDVLLADVHEWHGNTPLIGIEGYYERISCVLYYREKMVHCGTAEEERVKADGRSTRRFVHGEESGGPIYD